MENCVFCKIVKKQIPSSSVYEDESTLAFLDISPVSEGHLLIIPKEHAERIHQLSEKSASALMETTRKLSRAIELAYNCDLNLLNNIGKMAGQAVFHVHFHLIPRRGEKGEFHFDWPHGKLEHPEKHISAIKSALAKL